MLKPESIKKELKKWSYKDRIIILAFLACLKGGWNKDYPQNDNT